MSIRKLGIGGSVLVLWVALLGVLALPALAAQEKPELTVEDTTAVVASPSTEALLRGVLNPAGVGEEGTYKFLYKASKTGVCTGDFETMEGISPVGEREEPAEPIAGLAPGTEYAVCLHAENNAKTESATSTAVTFTTPVKPEKPETTSPAQSITATTATLEGTLNPKSAGDAGTYEFLYRVSATECEGERASPTEPSGVMSGAAKQAVSVPVSTLQPKAQYTFCLLARNTAGETAVGPPVHFTTPPAKPSIESESVSGVKATAARLEGVVNANNEATECEFQYGTEALLTTPTTIPCEPAVLNNFGGQGVGVTVGGLEAKTTYYYRVVATNGTGVTEETIGHFTTPTPPEAPTTKEPAVAITATSATLEGVLNPGGGGEAGSYEFVYRQSPTECQKPNPETGLPENAFATPTTPATAGTHAVTAPAEGLAPGGQYTFCLLIRNEAGETALGAPVTFSTLALAPTVGEESVTKVTSSSARLQAEVDPGGAETTYHFDYGTSAAYDQSTPESPSVGTDDSEHPAVAEIQGLQPGTTYHYRIVARNAQSPGGIPGPDETFTTQAVGGAFALPDSRAYELVSPAQKDGAEILGIGGGGQLPRGGSPTQVSEDGKSATYMSNAPIGEEAPTSAMGEQLFATRTAAGWSTHDISVPRNSTPQPSDGIEEYKAFSADLSRAVLLPTVGTAEAPLAPEIHQEITYPPEASGGPDEIYLRNDLTNTFQALVTSEPLPRVDFQGGSSDLSHLVFGAPAGLDPRYPAGGNLYEWAAGEAQLIDVLPDRQPASEGVLATGEAIGGGRKVTPGPARNAVSDDGTRVSWSGEGALFTRDMATEETQQVDAAQGGAGPSGGGLFVAASSDGTRVLFVDYNELTAGASGGGLFMFDADNGKLTDLTPAGNGGEMQSALGVNEEATSVYELSSAVLTGAANARGETAQAGASNLYLLRETPVGSGSWSTTFITDEAEGSGAQNGGEARPSPDGRYLAFMSRQNLTGYDSRDANSGEQDEEVYLYEADANRLVCASCNPTGARPVGIYDALRRGGNTYVDPMDVNGEWGGSWLAASVPGFTPAGFAGISSGYQPRYLSDSGRLFFDSADGLVPRDVNGHADVYEYEPVGVGSCQPPSYDQSASIVFDAAAGGCVGLISNGTRGTGSVFFDASANGNDVFFTTADGLVPQDTDGATDLYDARVCSQAEPCAQSPTAAQACTTADACRSAPVPEPGVFGSGPTETFTGAGNVTSTPAATSTPGKTTKKTTRCAKGKRLSRGRCVKRKGKAKKAKRAGNKRRAKR